MEFWYKICNNIVKSNLAFPEVLSFAKKNDHPDFIFHFIQERLHETIDCDWLTHDHLGNETWLHLAKTSSGYLIRFLDTADFLLSFEFRTITCYSNSISLETIRHLLLDQIIPFAIGERGNIVLHASAVALSHGAVAFIGESGQGKSTLAASFGRQGFPILTDDYLLLERLDNEIHAVPSYPGLRLWPDSVSVFYDNMQKQLPNVAHYYDKKRLDTINGGIKFHHTPVSLQNIYLLSVSQETSASDAVLIQKLKPAESLMELIKNDKNTRYHYSLSIMDSVRRKRTLRNLSLIVNNLVSVNRLSYSRNFDNLPKVLEAILDHNKTPRP